MRNRLLLGAAALASLIALGHFAAKPLLAQIRAALIKNIDERGRSPYMVNANCSANATECDASFPAVPANKRFVVEYANGHFIAPSGQFSVAFLSPEGATDSLVLLTHLEATNLGYDSYTISMPAVFYYESGFAPSWHIFVNKPGPSGFEGYLTLSGYLVDLTQ